MRNLYELPTLNELVGSLIAILAIGAIVYLAIDGNAAAQTALVSVAGAAAGTYYASNSNKSGNGKAQTGTESAPEPPKTP